MVGSSSRLAGRTIVVTGGARGMGAAHATRIVDEGGRVVLTDVRDDLGEELASRLGSAARYVHADVTSPDDWTLVIEMAGASFGAPNGLINNAAILESGTVETTTLEQYERVTAVLQTSVFLGMRAVIPGMKRHGGGSIVNISATGGLVGFRNIFAYLAAKWAVRGMSKAAALELAPYGIRVNSIHPGEIATPMVFDNEDGGIIPAFDAIPLGRYGEPPEVAALAAFLLSEDSAYITGAEHIIDGGYTAQ
jgi:3alpha(or 20beta)-hydroxysteroid dehydrogenase